MASICFGFIVILFLFNKVVIEARDVGGLNNNNIDLSDNDILNNIPEDFPHSVFSTGCSIAINNNGLPEPQPLIIATGTNDFVLPERLTGIVRLAHQETVELFCSVSFTLFAQTRNLIAQCIGNDLFLVAGKEMNFNELRCTGQIQHTGRFNQIQNCGHNATALEIGFQLNPTRFLKTLDICHDERLESTLYVKYEQTPANQGFQRSFPRPGFVTGIFFNNRNVDRLYLGTTQRVTIGNILGESRVEELWDNSRNFFLARGHLSARADAIYGSHQRATFYFVNAAPQWQSFNAGNWERIEDGVRQMVAERNIFTEIYTGTFGILSLPDINNVKRELYLDFDANGQGLIPVPTFFYKVIIDKNSQRGVAFIGVNNPHATWDEVNSGIYDLCRDVSDEINYIRWERANLARGHSYACYVNDFVPVVKHLPKSVARSQLLI